MHNTVFSFFSKIGQIGTLEEVISFEITFCGNSSKSIMGMMSLNLSEGENVTVITEGTDEAAAADGVVTFFSKVK
ncbi:MAG: HPr family phosphocarrier protein [Hespellia sp.]|nr:HPr family phosphocarrier protein [Hespellia sp.]